MTFAGISSGCNVLPNKSVVTTNHPPKIIDSGITSL